MRLASVGSEILRSFVKGNVMCPLTKTVQEIEERVDDPPGQITAEHFHQHSADAAFVGRARVECTRERENHDEPKQELRNSLYGFQNPIGLACQVRRHFNGSFAIPRKR
jgi:hypothetical protein